MTRALRRHLLARRKARARRLLGQAAGYGYDGGLTPRRLGIYTDTRTPCSCWACRSPRYKRSGRAEVGL
jgi:hypothetical protein